MTDQLSTSTRIETGAGSGTAGAPHAKFMADLTTLEIGKTMQQK